MNTHYCPKCNLELTRYDRYPNYVCGMCVSKSANKAGRKLVFSNVDFSGGFKAIYKDTKEIYDSHICYINGIKCYEDEARFGGIAVEKMEDL